MALNMTSMGVIPASAALRATSAERWFFEPGGRPAPDLAPPRPKGPLMRRSPAPRRRMLKASVTTKPVGRPPKPDEERKASNLTLRVRRNLRDRLEHSATTNGRSISEETEQRLEASFREQDLIRAFGGTDSILRPILFFLAAMEPQNRDWLNNRPLAAEAVEAISLITEAVLVGPISTERQTTFLRASSERRGKGIGNAAKTAISVLRTLGLAASPSEREK
jgi:Arc-like DNA binding domain